jgi:hypothetical protein
MLPRFLANQKAQRSYGGRGRLPTGFLPHRQRQAFLLRGATNRRTLAPISSHAGDAVLGESCSQE